MKKTIFILILFCFATKAFCYSDYLGDLGTVVVTPTRSDRITAFVPSDAVVITKKDIQESAAQSIPELLGEMTGISVQDWLGNGNKVSVDILGFGETAASNVLVMVDGRRMDSPDMAGTDWQQITIDQIERVEVIKGSGSVLYGDNSSGGVINIVTKKDKQEVYSDMSLWSSSYKGFGGAVKSGGEVRGVNYSLGTHYSVNQGYRENNENNIKNITGRINFPIQENIHFDLSSGYQKDRYGLPGYLFESEIDNGLSRKSAKNTQDYSISDNSYFHSVLNYRPIKAIGIELNYNYQNKEINTLWTDWSNLNERNNFRNTLGLKVTHDLNMGKIYNRITGGIDWDTNKLKVNSKNSVTGDLILKDKIELNSKGIYLFEEVSPFDSFMISGGVRTQDTEYEFEKISPLKKENAFNLGASYIFNPNIKLYINWTDSFRLPKTDEYYNLLTDTLNKELKTQRSSDYQVGLELYEDKNNKAGIHWFESFVDNEIYYNPATSSNQNYEKTKHSYIEIKIGNSFLDTLKTQVRYKWINAVFVNGKFSGNTIPGVPEYLLSFKSQIEVSKKLKFNLFFENIGDRFLISDFSNEKSPNPSYNCLDIGILYTLDIFNLEIKINNVLNEKYSEYGVLSFSGNRAIYPSPERNFVIKLGFEY